MVSGEWWWVRPAYCSLKVKLHINHPFLPFVGLYCNYIYTTSTGPRPDMKDGKSTAKFLPFSWAHKSTGVNIRARIRGANVARKLVMEFTVSRNEVPQHKAFLEFHAWNHVSEYGWSDKTIKDHKTDKKGTKRSGYENSPDQDSFLILRFVPTGGIGIGLDFDADYFDQDDREVLYYARHLARNFSQSPDTPKHVAFRLNARWVEYGLEQTKNIRKREEWERLQRAVSQFSESPSQVFALYRSQQGTPLTQWGMFAARSLLYTLKLVFLFKLHGIPESASL